MIRRVYSMQNLELLKNCLTLLSANSISQIIAISAYPLITRLYNPADLGALSLFLSFAGIASIIASGKYESAILLEKETDSGAAVFDLVFVINLFFCICLFILIYIFKDPIISVFKAQSISSFFLYLPIYIFFTVLGYVSTFWYNRDNKFRVSAKYCVSQSVMNTGLKIGLGGLGFSNLGLIFSTLVAQITASALLFINKKNRIGLFVFDPQRLVNIAKRHYRFPTYSLPHSLINAIAGNIPIIILSAWFNMTEVGLFALGFTLGFRPVNLMSESINQVLFQRVSYNNNHGLKSYSLLKQFCLKTITIGLPLFIVLFIFIKPITMYLFSSKWIGAGEYLQYMMPWFFITIMASSLCFMPAVVGRQKTAMIIEFIYSFVRISALFFGVWLHNIQLAIILYSYTNAIFISGQLIWFLYLAKEMDKKIISSAEF